MAFAKFQGNQFKIDGIIGKNHAILVDQFYWDFGYIVYLIRLITQTNHCYCD